MHIDYSNVATRDDLLGHVETGSLVKMFLLPEIFGGEDRKENVVFVPPFAVDQKEELDSNTIRDLIMQRKINSYEAIPSFVGDSLVPSFVTVKVHGPEYFVFVIKVWSERGAA
ncbi:MULTISPECIES: hypothetical protein [unclassified Novosphingobium]|uniref:hypothetical protein n=1 Tax=unclassified Novosphingobium TaxID=2644732 RepID=UPI0025FA093A|nr:MULTISPECIES: hypothetical protein [unclassified Novosphingobium]HQV03537.1 hypothetical protein [Novosphingobium sp.]